MTTPSTNSPGEDTAAGDAVAFDLADAAAEMRRVAENVRDDQLESPTPCSDWTVRDLAEHICGLTRVFAEAARHETPRDEPANTGLPESWREELSAGLDSLVAAWREPEAWTGEADAGGVRMRSDEMAVVVLDELVLHGWDLARSTGQDFVASDADIAVCMEFASAMSTPETVESRDGLYGPVIEMTPDSSAFAKLLGLAGRNPSWP